MHIYIDESGNFIESPNLGAISTVCALAVPERNKRKTENAVWGGRAPPFSERKANDLSEPQLLNIFDRLAQLDAMAVGVAIDMGGATKSEISNHKARQADKIQQSSKAVTSEIGKANIIEKADTIRALSNQLYVQMVCQLVLLAEVLHNSTLYYSQHEPIALKHFRWQIDQKNQSRTKYEKIFYDIAPIILQTMSLERPLITLSDPEFNYTHMKEYEKPASMYPAHLTKATGREPRDTFDVSKIFWSNLKFADSKQNFGLQAVDIIATCTRRCMQAKFDNPELIASKLGNLFPTHPLKQNCLELVTLKGGNQTCDDKSAAAINIMNSSSSGIVSETS